jgi:GxxExxY protein
MDDDGRKLLHQDLTAEIIGASIDVHKELGPGLLESAYESCLYEELVSRGLLTEREKPLAVRYKNALVECGYRLDLLVERKVIVEIKSIEKLQPIHEAQLLTYLKLANVRTGLLINFNVTQLRRGIVRRVL